jgi:hypothetical protein
MTIGEILRHGFHYAWTCRSLWLFGFVVGAASGGSSGSGGSGGGDEAGGAAAAGLGAMLSIPHLAAIAIAVLLFVVAAIVMRFVSEGALIEGIVQAREGRALTTREGFRAGWAHWGVLLRIALLFVAAFAGSVVVLAAPGVLAIRAYGWSAGLALVISALVIGVPWLITLYIVQAFAWRIAVLENRRAIDAIRKSRLFLHGRLMHGLKLIVAMFVGTVAIGLCAAAVLVPMALLLVWMLNAIGVVPAIVIACIVLLPAIGVLTAMLGTFRSSIWTIGYVTEAGS